MCLTQDEVSTGPVMVPDSGVHLACSPLRIYIALSVGLPSYNTLRGYGGTVSTATRPEMCRFLDRKKSLVMAQYPKVS